MRRLYLIIAAGAAVLALLASIGIASASFLGDRWQYTNNTFLRLTYSNQAGSYPEYAAAINTAASAWWNTHTPLMPASTTADTANVRAVTYSDSTETSWGNTPIHEIKKTCLGGIACGEARELPYQLCATPCSGTISGAYEYWYADIWLNRFTMDSLTAAEKQKVAVHEFGHAFGLAHTNCGTSIMQQGSLSFNKPGAKDLYDISLLYPHASYMNPSAC